MRFIFVVPSTPIPTLCLQLLLEQLCGKWEPGKGRKFALQVNLKHGDVFADTLVTVSVWESLYLCVQCVYVSVYV